MPLYLDTVAGPVRVPTARCVRRLGGLAEWEVVCPQNFDSLPDLLGQPAAGDSSAENAEKGEDESDKKGIPCLRFTYRVGRKTATVHLATELRLIGGTTDEDNGPTILRFGRADLIPAELIPRRRFLLPIKDGTPTLGNFFERLKSLDVPGSARTNWWNLSPWVVVQDGLSDLELAVRLIDQHLTTPQAKPLALTGIRRWCAVSLEPADISRPTNDPGGVFNVIGATGWTSSSLRSTSPEQSVPLMVLRRTISTTEWADKDWKAKLEGELDRPLPWTVTIPAGVRTSSVPGRAVRCCDEFTDSADGPVGWRQTVTVLPDAQIPPVALPGPGRQPAVFFGKVVKKDAVKPAGDHSAYKPENIILVQVEGFESGYDVLPVYVTSPYTGTEGTGGVNLIPEPGTPVAALCGGGQTDIAVLLGNVRMAQATLKAPSVEMPAVVRLAPGPGFQLADDKEHFKVTDHTGGVSLDLSATGMIATATDKNLEFTAKQLKGKVSEPVKVNGTEVKFQ